MRVEWSLSALGVLGREHIPNRMHMKTNSKTKFDVHLMCCEFE